MFLAHKAFSEGNFAGQWTAGSCHNLCLLSRLRTVYEGDDLLACSCHILLPMIAVSWYFQFAVVLCLHVLHAMHKTPDSGNHSKHYKASKNQGSHGQK